MLNEIVDSDIYVYMNEIGYKFIAKTLNTLFFKKC